ncbi:MAG TPA: MFS transporter [Acidimicrobiales bacterium]
MLLHRNRRFARLWIGQVVSVVGDGMQRVALLWWATGRGGTTLLVAIAASGIVPMVALSPLGGWAADRYDRRVLLVAADLLRFVSVLLLAAAVGSGNPHPLLVCALVAVMAAGTALFDPTYNAAVPTLVSDEDLASANGLNLANSAAGGLAGPIVGGLLLAWMGVGTVLVLNALTFAWSAAFVLSVRLAAPSGAATAESTAGRELFRDHELLRLCLLAAVLNMVVAPVPLLIVTLAVRELAVGAGTYGLLQAMISGGLLVGALAAGALVERRGALRNAMVVVAACLGALSLVPLAGAFVALAVGGVAIAVANTSLITTFQRAVPPELLGRAFGTLGALSEGLRPAGLLLAGPLLAGVGARGAFAVVGSGVLAATLTWARPAVRPQSAALSPTRP